MEDTGVNHSTSYKWYVNGEYVGEGHQCPPVKESDTVTLHVTNSYGTYVTNAVDIKLQGK